MKTRFRFLYVLFPIAAVGLGSLALMGLWNWLMPGLFGFAALTFLQALGILVLMRILTWGGGWFRWAHWRGYAYATPGCSPQYHPYFRRHEYWKTRMKEKWESMSPKEKEKWKNRCGGSFWQEPDQKEEPIKA